MTHLRVLVRPRAMFGTPLVSGTFWGHLAWAMRHLRGEVALAGWLEDQARAPWLISSAMPEGFLPRPVLVPSGVQHEGVAAHESAKRVRRLRWVPEHAFAALRNAMSARALDEALDRWVGLQGKTDDAHAISVRTTHNSIDRRISSTPERGGLYVSEAWLPAKPGARVQLFAATPEGRRGVFEELVGFVAEHGYGRDASTGNGVFDFEISQADELFSAKGNRAMSLAHGTIGATMKEPRYRLHTHYGRLGSYFAQSADTPFKRPILMAAPGATFGGDREDRFGAFLGGAYPGDARVVHHALHLPLWFSEVAP